MNKELSLIQETEGKREIDYGDLSRFQYDRFKAEYAVEIITGSCGAGINLIEWIEFRGYKHEGRFKFKKIQKAMSEEIIPNPGTEEAIGMGCTCPVMDNEYGRGYQGQEGVFVFNMCCPIHAGDSVKEEIMSETQKEK